MNWDGVERRQFVRVAFPCEISVYTTRKEIIPSRTENISTGGVRILLDKKLKTASIISMDIYGIKSEPIICNGRVVWVFKRNRGGNTFYDTGIEFHKIKEKDVIEIQNLIISLTQDKTPY